MNRCTLLNTSCSKYTFIFIFELRLRVLDTPFDDSMSQYDDFKLLSLNLIAFLSSAKGVDSGYWPAGPEVEHYTDF